MDGPDTSRAGPGADPAVNSPVRSRGPAGSEPVQAAVVWPASGPGTVYRMYEALNVTQEGATLRGGLLLEVNEELTLELRMSDRSSFRAVGRVVGVVFGHPPTMKVAWTGLADSDRRRLHRV